MRCQASAAASGSGPAPRIIRMTGRSATAPSSSSFRNAVTGRRVLLHVVCDPVARQDGVELRSGVLQRAITRAVAGDHRAGVGEYRIRILREPAVVHGGHVVPAAAREREREPAAHAEADHADLVRAVGTGQHHPPRSLDVLEGAATAGRQRAERRHQAFARAALGEEVRHHCEIAGLGHPLHLPPHVVVDVERLVHEDHARPRPLALRNRHDAAQSCAGSDDIRRDVHFDDDRC